MPDTMEFSRKPILVLGASGYIGVRVVSALAGRPRYRPIEASRHSAPPVDATDLNAVTVALQNVDCVINCIAGNDRAMVLATQTLCDAARGTPPRRIVHLSSMAVYGAVTGRVHEDQQPTNPISGYGRAKAECERIILKYVSDGGDAVILRPTCVFGAGSPQWFTRLARLLKAHRIGDLGTAGDGCCNLAYIDDLVAGILEATDGPDVSGRAFNISSTSDLTWNEFLIMFAKALGATPVRRIAPRTLTFETKILAPIRRIAAMAVHGSVTEAITPSLAALWRQDIRIDCSAARATLGLPQTTAEQMLAATCRAQEPAFS